MTRWLRSEAELSIGEHLWRFSGASQLTSVGTAPPADPGVAVPTDLFEDILRIHLALGGTADRMLTAAEEIVRRTPGTVAPQTSQTVGYVEGAVLWGPTIEHQLRTGDDTTFICSQGRRRFETLSTRVLTRALTLAEEFARPSASGEAPAAQEARSRLERSRRLQIGKLARVRPINFVTEDQLARVAERPGMADVVEFLELSRDALSLVPSAVERVLSEAVIAPADDDTLFELEVGFRLVEVLVAKGFAIELLQAIRGTPFPFAELRRGDDRIQIWYQRSLRALRKDTHSLYSSIRSANGLRASSLIPDFILRLPGGRTVVVEAKLTHRSTRGHVRHGISDALAYLLDTHDVFAGHAFPHAVVVAWDVNSTPNATARIAVADIASLEGAFAGIP